MGGMLLRLAVPEDAMAVARVHVRSWQVAYRGLLPDEYLEQLRAEDRAQRYDFTHADALKPRTIVAVDEAEIQSAEIHGFATTMPGRDQDLDGFGELCAIYVDPESWGRGVGTALIEAARGHLAGTGFQNALVWVLAGNARAMRFYERDGWIADGDSRTDVVWGATVHEVRYRRELEAP